MVWRFENDSFDKYNFRNNKKVAIIQLDMEGTILKEYDSIVEAAIQLKCKPQAISRVLRGIRKSIRKTYFKYKDIV